MYHRAQLGDVDVPLDEDFAGDLPDGSSSDPRAAYVAWAAAVKQYGGTVTTFPAHNQSVATADPETGMPIYTADFFGMPAARYPSAVILPPPGYVLNSIFKHLPDIWSQDGAFGFYVAPAAVRAYTAAGGAITAPQSVPGESPPPNPSWYDDLVKYGKWAVIGVAGLAALEALSFLPRRR